MRKACINLSMTLRAGVDFFLRLPIQELTEIAKEAADTIGKHK